MISQYKKCWEVSWYLGWNITEWNVDEITFDCTTGDIIKLKCSKPYRGEIFNKDSIGKDVFFNEYDAKNCLFRRELTDE